MPRGPKPKPDNERQRANPPGEKAKPKIHVPPVWDGVTRGPELPMNLPGIKWCTVTLKWWEMWRNSPQAVVFSETDWAFLMDTALLHNRMWQPRREAVTNSDGKIVKRLAPLSTTEMKALSGEIRQRLQLFGATYTDRMSSGMNIGEPDKETPEEAARRAAPELVNYLDQVKMEVVEQQKRTRGE